MLHKEELVVEVLVSEYANRMSFKMIYVDKCSSWPGHQSQNRTFVCVADEDESLKFTVNLCIEFSKLI